MEIVLDSFFEEAFKNLDRGFLFPRYKRQNLVEYFDIIIEGCCSGEDGIIDAQYGCKKVVESSLKYHSEMCLKNNGICLLGKYHSILYIACKISFNRKLEDSETISKLLLEIYNCEKTYEKFFEGSIFGPRITKLISGWKSDYTTREENIKALKYFLDKATLSKLKVSFFGKELKFLDVPMNSYGSHSPLKVAIKAEKWDIVMLLIRYGAFFLTSPDDENFDNFSIVEPLLQILQEFYKRQNRNNEILRTIKLLLSAIPSVESLNFTTKSLEESFKINELVPMIGEDFGIGVPTLKHLARCTIRVYLNSKYELPFGIYKLPIPDSLKRYLDLLDEQKKF